MIRLMKEDHGDWEIIAKFRSKPFCIGDIDDVEDDLIDLMNTDEVAFKQIVDYLKSEGYSVGGEDFDADDYADWFTRELNDLFSVHNESDLKFGYFDFKVKNLSAYYDESIKRNKNNRRSIKEDIGDQGWYLKRVENYKDFCRRMTKLANNVESIYGDIEKYLEQANLSKSYLDRLGKLNADILDAWSHIDQAEVVASDLIKDMETFIKL